MADLYLAFAGNRISARRMKSDEHYINFEACYLRNTSVLNQSEICE